MKMVFFMWPDSYGTDKNMLEKIYFANIEPYILRQYGTPKNDNKVMNVRAPKR